MTNTYFDEDTPIYNELLKEKEQGRIFTKEDLTKEVMYDLAINENLADIVIAELFNITGKEVLNLRKKYKLQNKYLKKAIDDEEFFLGFLEEQNTLKLPQEILEILYYKGLELFVKSKNWSMKTFYEYLTEKIGEEAVEEYKNYDYDTIRKQINSRKVKRNCYGRKVNQLESFKSKNRAGKIGEKIVYKKEIERLKKLGLYKDIKDVLWITQTDDEEITFDGAGYDIVSLNEKGEKIYIEVKTSLTNKLKRIVFDISQKEVNFMNGLLKDIDKDHAFIYYVTNVDIDKVDGDILIINHEMFKKYNLDATSYHVNEKYWE